MPAVTRVGDNDTGHDACPPRPLDTGSGDVFVNKIKCGRQSDSYVDTGSGDVFVNKIKCGRQSDSYVAHGCIVHPPHTGIIASGSSTVYVNGLQIGRIGDPVSCGGSVAVGSGDVYAGG